MNKKFFPLEEFLLLNGMPRTILPLGYDSYDGAINVSFEFYEG